MSSSSSSSTTRRATTVAIAVVIAATIELGMSVGKADAALPGRERLELKAQRYMHARNTPQETLTAVVAPQSDPR